MKRVVEEEPNKMRVEIPEIKKCCFFLPLRKGLLIWVYLKLLYSITALVVYLFALLFIIWWGVYFGWVVAGVILLIFPILDMVFNTLFIVNAHKKNWVYLRVFYRYAVTILCFDAFLVPASLITCLIILQAETYEVVTTFGIVCLLFSQTALQLYFVLMVRSEVIKLRDNTQFQFTNLMPDPSCTAIYIQ